MSVRAGIGVRAVVLLIGFTAAIAQIVLLREVLVVCYGNEVSIGLMLASWLFWTAAGSGLAGRLRQQEPRPLMAAIETLLACVLPGTILAVRAARPWLQTVPGELLGPGVMLSVALAALSGFCLFSGALFTAGSRLYAAETAGALGMATGRVYLWEAWGSSAGGILAGIVLIRHWGSLEIAGLLALLNLLAAASLVVPPRLPFVATTAALLGASAWVALSGELARVEALSQEHSWRGFRLLDSRNSTYGSLAVVDSGASRSVYENGVRLFTAPDPAAAEEAVHYALLEQPAPHSLLLMGGGLNGSIAQALQHPGLERVDYVELDPAILELARTYFSEEWTSLAQDSRVRVHVTDGRLWLKTTQLSFDVIIVNLPDPQTAQLNRFYTVEFFQEAARRLTQEGVLAFQLTAAENYISPELAEFLGSIHKSLEAVFPEVTVLPGETGHFFATRRPGVLARDAGDLLARLRARHLQTRYVREYYIPFRLMPDRVRELAARIQPMPSTPLNRDFAPIAYYFDVALWSSRFHAGYSRFFQALARVDFGGLAAVLGALLAAWIASGRWLIVKERRLAALAAGCTATMGFSLIGLEMLLLLAFQAIYGYVYQQLALLIGAFMAGMAAGSALALRAAPIRAVRALAGLQVLTALVLLVWYGIFEAAARVTSGVGVLLVSQIVFPALALLSGALGGYEFPLASSLYFAIEKQCGPGRLYALDLAGACLGALVFSGYLIPVFGFFKTALLAALVSLAPAGLALLLLPEAKQEPALAPADGRRRPER